MNEPHIIRLRGPWQRQIIEGSEQPSKTITMPGGWAADLGERFEGTVEYQRFFNRPTGIDDSTPIRITFAEIVGQATVWLNSEQLPDGSTVADPNRYSFDISGQLEKRNELRVRIASNGEVDGGLVGEVRLEIG